MKTKRPEGGWPWEAEGYRFSIDWPPGYQCVVADQMMSGRPMGATASLTSSKTRERMMVEGRGWGSGTMAPFSDKSDPSKGGQIAGNERSGRAAFRPVHVPTGRPRGGVESSPERQEAQRRGLKRFSTGEPCSQGHVSQRYTCDAKCVECARLKKLKGTRSRAAKGPTQ